MAVVLSTELPFCVTDSPAIPRGGFILFATYDHRIHLLVCWHLSLCVDSSLFHSFAYIEFTDRDSVQSAIGLHETLFRGRVLKVRPGTPGDQTSSLI